MLVHARHRAVRAKLALDLVAAHGGDVVELGGVEARRALGPADERRAGLLEGEGTGGGDAGIREVREDRPERPGNVGVHVSEKGCEARRQVGEGQQQDAPHPAERVHVVSRAVRHRGASEGGGHVRETVRGQARQCDARERERVDPDVRDRRPTGDRLDERAVEGRVVCEHGGAGDELRQRRDGVARGGGVRHVAVGDAREPGYLRGYGSPGMHEGLEATHHLATRHTRRGYLDEVAVLEGEPRRLGVQDDDVLLERAEPPALGTGGQAEIAVPDLFGRARGDQL